MVTFGIFLGLIVVGTIVIIARLTLIFFPKLLVAQQHIAASGIVHYATLSNGSSWKYNADNDNKAIPSYVVVNAVIKNRLEMLKNPLPK